MGKKAREKKERKIVDKEELTYKRKGDEGHFLLTIIKVATYLALLAPLVVNKSLFFPFVGPKSIYFMAFAQVAFFSWLLLAIINPKYRPKLNIVLISLAFFIFIFILSGFFGEDLSRSFWSKHERMGGILMHLHLFGFFLAISSSFKKRSEWYKVFIVSISSAVIVAIISFLIKGGIDFLGQMTIATRNGSTLGNTSFMGSYFVFNIFLALYMFLKTKGWLRIYLGLAGPIMFYALVLSNAARAARISILLGLGLLFILYLSFKSGKKYLKLLGRVGLVGMLLSFLVIGFFLFQPGSIVHQWFVSWATYARLVVWEGAWQGFLDKPVLGWGPENFELAFTKYFNPCMFLSECGGEIWFDRAHNIVVDTLVMTGFLGLIAYLGIFISAFFGLWKFYFSDSKKAKEGEGAKVDFWAAGIFSVILIIYFIQNLSVFDMIGSYLMFFLVLGFISYLISQPKEEENKPTFNLLKEPSLFVLLLLYLGCFVFFIVQPINNSKKTVVAVNVLTPKERALAGEEALNKSSLGKYQIREVFADRSITSIQSKDVEGFLAEDIKMELDFLIGELEKTLEESSLDFKAYLKLGKLNNIYSQIDSSKILYAEKYLNRAIELSPTNQQAYWELAQTRLYQGLLEEALVLTQKAIELEPRLFDAHAISIRVANLTGNQEIVEEIKRRAIEINPQWEAQLEGLLNS